MKGLQNLGYSFSLRCDKLDMVDIACVKELLCRQMEQPFQGLDISPRTCPSPIAMLCTYFRWFFRPTYAPCGLPSHVTQIRVSASAVKAFLRFRCGSHNLPKKVGRRQGLPRYQRYCPKCHAEDSLAVGDEYHLVFECPSVQHVRDRYRDLFSGAIQTMHVRDRYRDLFSGAIQTMQELMWQTDMRSVALCVGDYLSVLLDA